MAASEPTESLRAFVEGGAGRLPTAATQRLAGALQRELHAHGPIPPARVDELAAGEPDADRERLEGFLETGAGGIVTAVMGLSATPTAHELRIDGRVLFTWCAFDALVFAAAHGWTAVLRSRCPASDTPVEVDVTPDAVRRVAPPEAVLTLALPQPRPLGTAAEIRATYCAVMNLYRSAELAHEGVGPDPRVRVVGLVEAHHIAKVLAARAALSPAGSGAASHDVGPTARPHDARETP